MASFEQNFLKAAFSQKDTYPKAIASFLFREIIEDAHAKYDISQSDMMEMCKMAVNRAALFLKIKDDPSLYRAFAIHALEGFEWDNAEETEDTKSELDMLQSLCE